MKQFYFTCLGIVLLGLVLRVSGLAGTSYGDYCLENKTCTIKMPAIVVNEEIVWTKEKQAQREHDEYIIAKFKEKERLEALEKSRKENIAKPTPKPQKSTKEVKETQLPCKSDVRIDLVNHAFKISNGDMVFLGTIASESMFDVGAIGDNGYSIGLCQFHRLYQPDNWKAYQTLTTDFHKLEFCHEKYEIWKKRGVLGTRLYGSNVWQNGLKKLNIKCE